MNEVRSYRDLLVWQKSLSLVKNIYSRTLSFPKCEAYGLSAQMRRAAVSIPSNIAEGQGRRGTGEFKQFLGTARGSALELETQLLIARDLGYLHRNEVDALLNQLGEIGRMLNGLLKALPAKRSAQCS